MRDGPRMSANQSTQVLRDAETENHGRLTTIGGVTSISSAADTVVARVWFFIFSRFFLSGSYAA